MRTVLRNILSRPVALAMACCIVAFGGVFALTRLPIGLAPSLQFPALSVHMSWGGASAESVEQTLTTPVEEIASSLRGVRKVRSASHEGWSRVNVEFDQQTDMKLVRLAFNEQLALFAQHIPPGASPPVVEPFVPEEIEQLQGFLSYFLAGPYSLSALARIADQEIVPRLKKVRGVAQVTLQGGVEEEIRVELVPEKLAAARLTVGDVVASLEAYCPESCKGRVQGPAGAERISLVDNVVSLSTLENTPVRGSESARAVRLRNVGRAAIVTSSPRELLRINGKPCLTLTIARDPDSNLPETAHSVQSCLDVLLPHLPPGVELICDEDQSRRMSTELTLLSRDGSLSLLLLWGMLALFLGNNRAPFVLIFSILLSIAGSLLALWVLHVPLHLLTLAGLVLGMGRLLDDSIVVLENLRRWSEPSSSVETIIEGTREVMMPVLASTAATAGAMMPVLFLPGDIRVYLREFAVTVAVSLSVSLCVSFTVIPWALAQWKMGGRSILLPPRGLATSAYRRLLYGVLRHRAFILLAAVWMFGFPVWLLPLRIDGSCLLAKLYNRTIGGSWYTSARPVINAVLGGASYQFFRNVPRVDFLDPGTETFLIMELDFPQGTGIARADAIARTLEEDLLRAGAPRLTAHVREGTVILRIDIPDSLIASSLTQYLRSRCYRLAAQTGGAAVSVAGFGAGLTGGADLQPAFSVRVLGYDYTRVKQIAESFRERLLRNPRVVSADIDRTLGNWSRAQEVVLLIDREAAARYNLTRREIAGAVKNRTSVLPRRMTVNIQGAYLPCVVTLKGVEDFSVGDLASVEVTGRNCAPVPLRALLRVQQRAAPSEILREDQQYIRWLSFEYKGPYRHAQAFLDATVDDFPLPEGYRFDRSDASEAAKKDRDALLTAALIGVLVVFMVTASLYESLLDPFVIILTVPFACIGVFLAFVLAGMPFGRGGYFSVIFLIGITVANAIVVVDFIGRKVRERGKSIEAVVEASVCRLRPVVMTTLATAGSLLPMLFGDRGSVWYSVALGTMGGILSSTLLTLLVIPVIYAVAYRIKVELPRI